MQFNAQIQALKGSPIFIVDDEPVNLKLIERVLAHEGYQEIHPIQNPEEVSARFGETRPNLILLDINMPKMNGFAVLDQLKSDTQGTLPPVVFLTAEIAAEHRTRAFEHGVLDFISKPFNRQELTARVRNLLSLELAHQQLTQEKSSLEQMVQKRTEALRKTQLQVVQILGKASEYRDNETGAHILRMSNISALLARKLGLADNLVEQILHASPMHDVGKIAIPDHILLKAGKFTPDEWDIMRSHTVIGHEILKAEGSGLLNMASEIALHHHEKWDGSGYPYKLSRYDIPVSCRVVAVADVFDALLSERPYKKPWSLDDAKAFMFAEAGKHFDPDIIRIFKDCLPEILRIRETYVDQNPTA